MRFRLALPSSFRRESLHLTRSAHRLPFPATNARPKQDFVNSTLLKNNLAFVAVHP
jgi:hypothetical protein